MIFLALFPYLELETVLKVTTARDSQLSSLKFFLLWSLSPVNSHCLSTFLLLLKSRSSQSFDYWSTSDQESQRPCSEIHHHVCIKATLSWVALSQWLKVPCMLRQTQSWKTQDSSTWWLWLEREGSAKILKLETLLNMGSGIQHAKGNFYVKYC